MMLIFASVIAFLLGAMIAVYQPMNADVSRILGSPLQANVLFYFVALVSSIAMMVVFGWFKPGDWKMLARIREIPPILILAGAMSAVMVLGTIILLPQLGARRLFLLQVSGQVVMAIIVSHFGLLATAPDHLTPIKALGALLLLAGAAISVL
jgi:transporter family-2 protein